MQRKLLSIFVLLIITFGMISCDGSSSSGLSFINWTGSVNGEIVVDATNDEFKFTSPEGYLYFGSTTYTNFWVDGNDLYYNGDKIGDVTYIKSEQGNIITGLVSNSGFMIDIYGPEDNLIWKTTDIVPVFTTLYSKNSDSDIDSSKAKIITSVKSGLKPYFGEPNAFTNDSSENIETKINH
jgi:hypothetical protein